jgi:hypothetical protein
MRRTLGELPAWPALPQRDIGERSQFYSAVGFPGLQLDRRSGQAIVRRSEAVEGLGRLYLAYLENELEFAAIDFAQVAALDLLRRMAEPFPSALAIQGHLVGPVSLALQLIDEQRRPLIYDEVLFDALTRFVRLRAGWQEASLMALAPATIMCLDETFAEAVGSPFVPMSWDAAIAQIDEVLAGVAGCRGLIAQGELPLAALLDSTVELLVIDGETAQRLPAAAAPLALFLERERALGFAVVPSTPDELASADLTQLADEVERLIEPLADATGLTPRLIAQRSFVAARGPLGGLEVAQAEQGLQLLAALSARLRERFGLAE